MVTEATSRADTPWTPPARQRDDPPWQPEEWIEDDGDTSADRNRPERTESRQGGAERPRSRSLPSAVAAELPRGGGQPGAKLADRLGAAHRAYQRDRFLDARRLLVPLAQAAPDSPTVRELLGLSYYRLGQWRPAIRELEAWYALTGETTLNPFLADAHRALGHHPEVSRLWDELRRASPDAPTVAEGRIVFAGSLADRGDLKGAIALLETGRLRAKNPSPHHLRLWYALADLSERAGDLPKARDLFDRIAAVDPRFVDVRERRRNL